MFTSRTDLYTTVQVGPEDSISVTQPFSRFENSCTSNISNAYYKYKFNRPHGPCDMTKYTNNHYTMT